MRTRELHAITALATIAFAALGCRQDMHDQPRNEPLEESDFFEDGRSARPLVAGTVPRGHLRDDEHLYTGRTPDGFHDRFPFRVAREELERGRERYEIFCAPCHDRVGQGEGMVVRHGFPKPRSFHDPEVRAQPVGYYFDAITRGFGTMADYSSQIPARDRWCIVAYLRALQRSQNARAEDLPEEELSALGAR